MPFLATPALAARQKVAERAGAPITSSRWPEVSFAHVLSQWLGGSGEALWGSPKQLASAGSVVVSDDLKVELERYLDAVSVEARALLEGLEREYDVAWRLYRLSFD